MRINKTPTRLPTLEEKEVEKGSEENLPQTPRGEYEPPRLQQKPSLLKLILSPRSAQSSTTNHVLPKREAMESSCFAIPLPADATPDLIKYARVLEELLNNGAPTTKAIELPAVASTKQAMNESLSSKKTSWIKRLTSGLRLRPTTSQQRPGASSTNLASNKIEEGNKVVTEIDLSLLFPSERSSDESLGSTRGSIISNASASNERFSFVASLYPSSASSNKGRSK